MRYRQRSDVTDGRTTHVRSVVLVRIVHLPTRCREDVLEAVIPGAFDNLARMRLGVGAASRK